MIAPNSLARQKEGVQGEEGDQRKVGQTGTPMPGTDATTDLSQSGAIDPRNRRKHEWWYGVALHR